MSETGNTMRDVAKVVFGCLGVGLLFIAVVGLLILGGSLYLDQKDKAAIANDLPNKLRVVKVQSLDVCSRVFGGYSFVATIPISVSKQIKKQGLVFFRDAAPSKDIQGDYEWKSGSALPPPDEFAPKGLGCLSEENEKKYRNFDRFEARNQSYFVVLHPRAALYVIPRLNVLIGGFDPR